MTHQDYFTNHFLIAMPALADPNFDHTVTYICEHNEQGAMGIVINRPMDITLGDVLKQMELQAAPGITDKPVFAGGPVMTERGFVLHRPPGKWETTLAVTDEISLTTSRDILDAMAEDRGPEEAIVALGYAGWGAGQLEAEFAENAWLSTPADPRIMFDMPCADRWMEATRLIGIDPGQLTDHSGHA